MFLCLSTVISVAKSIPKSKRLQGLPSINFSPKTLAMPSDYSTGLEGHFAIFLLGPASLSRCSVGHDVASLLAAGACFASLFQNRIFILSRVAPLIGRLPHLKPLASPLATGSHPRFVLVR